MPSSAFHHAMGSPGIVLGFGLGCFLFGMGVGGLAIVWLLP